MNSRTDNALTTPNGFDLRAVFEIAMWLSLRDAISFLTVNKTHNTLLQTDRFWALKIDALNFFDFLLRVNELTKAAQASMFSSLMSLEDRKMMDLMLSMDLLKRYEAYYVYRFRTQPAPNAILLSDGAVIALFEKLIDIQHIETNSRLSPLLDNYFILSALRDKLTSIEKLLSIERPTLNDAIESNICKVLDKLIKEKINSATYINIYHKNKNDTSYEISIYPITESQKNLVCQQFLALGIKATQKKEHYLSYITLETSAHNLRLALQKMPALNANECLTKKTSTPKLTHMTTQLFFPRSSPIMATYRPEKLTLRPKKPRRV